MASKFGGGGVSCKICDKTVYPAEQINFEKIPYHVECFRCSTCDKKMEGAGKAAAYDGTLYCHGCFSKGGFAQKQKNVKWTKKEGGGSAIASKFGGGGTPCKVCAKTVYTAETVSYEKEAYHADCFTCTEPSGDGVCGKKLTPSGAASYDGRILCTKCFGAGGYNRKQAKSSSGGSAKSNSIASRFGGGGNKCTVCAKTVYTAETVSYEKKPYHAECFTCTEPSGDGVCGKKLTPSGANEYENRIICTKCFSAGGYNRKQAKSSGTASTTSNSIASKFGGGGNKCVRCTKTVYPAETVSYEKNFFHSDCFTCKNCDKKVTTATAQGKKLEDGGVDVYCTKCWSELGLNRASTN